MVCREGGWSLNQRGQADAQGERQRKERAAFQTPQEIAEDWMHVAPSNGSRLSCGALKKESSFNILRAPPASSAC